MAANAFILVNADPANTGEVIQRLGAIAGDRACEVLSPTISWWTWKQTSRRISPLSCGIIYTRPKASQTR